MKIQLSSAGEYRRVSIFHKVRIYEMVSSTEEWIDVERRVCEGIRENYQRNCYLAVSKRLQHSWW